MRLATRYYQLDYQDAAVRWIKSGDVEIIRMIYSAVRDQNWGTLEPKILEENIIQNNDGFEVVALVEYQKNNIFFEAEYKIVGKGNRLKFEIDGKAKSTFKSNRIGICVLHPIKECAGKICTIIHPDQTSENVTFPEMVSPDQPMMNIAGLEWNPIISIKAKLSFSGDIFEMEDQRNWTDESYKTYCRPLKLPFPYNVRTGEKIRQKILLEIQGIPKHDSKENYISLKIDKNKKFKIPEIGVCSTNRKEPLEQSEAEILRQLPIKHLRGEIKLFEEYWELNLQRVAEESILLNLPLFLVIYFSENYRNEVYKLGITINKYGKLLKYILAVDKNHLYDNELFENTFQVLKELLPTIKIGAGVNAYFAELNRNRPQTEKAEFISYAVCPQVHAFDEATLIENLEGQKSTVESAKALFPRLPVFVSPVTLKQRFNVVANLEEPEPKPGELPYQVDARQNTIFAAQWFLGSLKYLSHANADLVTYFETVGWGGFIQGNHNPPVPKKFTSRKGEIFPIFNLLKEFSGYDDIFFCESSSPWKINGIVLSKASLKTNEKILISNLTRKSQKLILNSQYYNSIKRFSDQSSRKLHREIIDIPAFEIIIIETKKSL